MYNGAKRGHHLSLLKSATSAPFSEGPDKEQTIFVWVILSLCSKDVFSEHLLSARHCWALEEHVLIQAWMMGCHDAARFFRWAQAQQIQGLKEERSIRTVLKWKTWPSTMARTPFWGADRIPSPCFWQCKSELFQNLSEPWVLCLSHWAHAASSKTCWEIWWGNGWEAPNTHLTGRHSINVHLLLPHLPKDCPFQVSFNPPLLSPPSTLSHTSNTLHLLSFSTSLLICRALEILKSEGLYFCPFGLSSPG